MFGKNIFRSFLYLVVAIVLLKLCYNLGYGLVNRKTTPATGPVPAKTAPADLAAAAPTTAAPQ